MNKSNLKRYAPQARKDFIAAVTGRAQLLGLTLEAGGRLHVEPCTVQGDVALISGRPWPAKVFQQRQNLYERMAYFGYDATLEAIAYTWFNRLAALRYMELHDYLGHGRRVLSNAEGGLPEVLTHALDLAEAGDLPGLRADTVRDLKLANQDGELYRRVLLAQCNALNTAMPFLFEALDDETELLLPDNLLLSDSIVAKLVAEIPEEDWTEVEAIGWLYQFYISEKKDQVIGKVVKSEDIPAATQLFTPNWIVQYLVQNSVGRLWLMANPTSTLASQWPYYIQPAEQTPEVQAQLDALIQTRIAEDGEALNPETLTVLDPACGSGHILVVAYDVLKAIYLERGYQPRAIPRLILEKNLYGLDIDDRAAQLAAFALLMKARADDRRLFNDPPKLNVLSLQESKGLNTDELATHLAPFGLQRAALKTLLDTFEHAKTFGSLIQIPAGLNGQLAAMTEGLQQALRDGDLYARQAAKDVLPLVWQALVLGMQFDAVVANPPYMGSKGMNGLVKGFAEKNFQDSKSDLFAISVERFLRLSKASGLSGFMTPFSWMFLKSYEPLRRIVVDNNALQSLILPEYHAFFDSAFVSVSAYVILNSSTPDFSAIFIKLSDFYGSELQPIKALEAIRNPTCDWRYSFKSGSFKKIPGAPIAFWATDRVVEVFEAYQPLSNQCSTRKGMSTGMNAEFVRAWHEVKIGSIGFNKTRSESKESGQKWFPYANGGNYRKWYGNYDDIVNWETDGHRLQTDQHETGRLRAVNLNLDYIFRTGLSWSSITSDLFSIRLLPPGFLFSSASNAIFHDTNGDMQGHLALLNSKVHALLAKFLNPTVNANPGDIGKIPTPTLTPTLSKVTDRLVQISRHDWDLYERSWDFKSHALLIDRDMQTSTLESSYSNWTLECQALVSETATLEAKSNRLLIDAYGLTDELTPDIPDEQVTLTVNPVYRYGKKLTADERAERFRQETLLELVSYAVGCMMGRYSLDEPGLIYAHAGNIGFDPSRYEKKFPADADGIVPITDERWFEDDAASRVREFLRAVWGADTLEENMAWLAESLGTKGNETPDETIRRYLADKFFKDHLQTYKKRPIYWLFSSGKQGAFQALVYLHRYHEGTLARLRAEYVLPLTGKMQARMESLEADIRAASSTAARTKLTKQLEKAKKQHLELLTYDEKLRHYADQRIALDLDDGVKVNYGKFGDLLAEVKAVTGGGKDEE